MERRESVDRDQERRAAVLSLLLRDRSDDVTARTDVEYTNRSVNISSMMRPAYNSYLTGSTELAHETPL